MGVTENVTDKHQAGNTDNLSFYDLSALNAVITSSTQPLPKKKGERPSNYAKDIENTKDSAPKM